MLYLYMTTILVCLLGLVATTLGVFMFGVPVVVGAGVGAVVGAAGWQAACGLDRIERGLG